MSENERGDLKPQDLNLRKDKSRLENVQERLYSPNSEFDLRPRRTLSNPHTETKIDWEPPKEDKEPLAKPVSKKKKLSFVGWAAIVAFVFFIGAIGYGGYVFFSGLSSASGKEVNINIVGPVSIGGGEEMSIDVIVSNNNKVDLRDVNVIVEPPSGSKFIDSDQEINRLNETVGSVSANTVVKKSFDFIVFGEEGDNKEINSIVTYKIDGSNAIFEKEKKFNVAIQSSPVRISIDSVSEVTANQDLLFNIELTSNSNNALNDVLLTVDYPFGFTFIESSEPALSNNNVWRIDELAPKTSKNFTILGQLEGQNREERVFKFSTGLADSNIEDEIDVLFSSIPQAVTISRPFFGLDILIDNDSRPVIVKTWKSRLGGKVEFKNNTDDVIKNAEVELDVKGAVLDQRSLDAQGGFYDSNSGKMFWNTRTTEKLETILPGQTVVLGFSFNAFELANENLVFKNPEITLDGSIKGLRVNETGVDEQIESAVFRRIQFESDVDLNSTIGYVTGPFVNTGPRPLTAGEDTSLTVTLVLSNSSNTVENGKVTAVLPDYVKWNNKISPTSENVTFDQFTRTIEWNVGTLDEHVGYLTPAKELSFQVTITPSISQVGQVPILLNSPTFSGLDTFVNKNITRSDISIQAVVPGEINNQVVQ
jgi:hypothetical protein